VPVYARLRRLLDRTAEELACVRRQLDEEAALPACAPEEPPPGPEVAEAGASAHR
jgi:hypothetical protein